MSRRPKPLSPADVDARAEKIPQEVFDAFDELLLKEWDGHSAVISQDRAATAALKKLKKRLPNMTRQALFDRRWLDVEPAYRERGWCVKYDKPGYCESYEATFTFTKPRRGGSC